MIGAADYLSDAVPSDYKCGNCGITGIKLWREYQTSHPELRCAKCAGEVGKKSIEGIDADGTLPSEFGVRTDSIGWYVPAVPTEDGIGWWGYTSVPDAGVNWWRRLPTLSS